MGRPKGSKTGNVFFNKSKGKWFCEYYVIDKDTHKEVVKQKTVSNKEEGKQFLSSLQYQKGNEIFIKNNGIPLGKLMRSNVQRKLDMNLISENQYARVLKTIQIIEKNDIANKKIEDITSNDIQTYINSLKDYSNSYIKKLMEQFTQSYTLAMNKGYITKNPMLDVIKPKSTKADKEVRAMTIEEQKAFTDYLLDRQTEEEPYKNVYLIQMYTGLRVGEALALKSSDIDLRKNLIRVNKTLTVDKDGKVTMGNTTKTYAGIREVPIPEFIRDSIIEQMEISKSQKDHQLFMSPKGSYVDNRNVNRILKKRLSELDITGISTRSLRHTYGTRCVEAGMRAVAIQRLMGHKDVSVTLNIYTSVFNKYKEDELEKVNNYYKDNEIIRKNIQNIIEDDIYFSEDYFNRRLRILKEIYLIEHEQLRTGVISFPEYEENVKILKQLSQREANFDYDEDYEKTATLIQTEYILEQFFNRKNKGERQLT